MTAAELPSKEGVVPLDDSVPLDNSAPRDNAVPLDNSVPPDGAVPPESAVPRESAVPPESAVPRADTLTALRARIDAVDDALVGLMVERLALAAEAGATKRAAGLPVRDATREAEILARARARAGGRLPEAALRAIFLEILAMTRAAAEGAPDDPGADRP